MEAPQPDTQHDDTEPREPYGGLLQDIPWAQKLLATAVHVSLSIVAVGSLLGFVFYIWYPDFLFQTDGGWQGLRIVILVDLVLGPMLTFVVYRKGKQGLLMDLALIAAMQIAALFAGGWILYSERPLALVFDENRIFSISRDDYLDYGQAVPDLSELSASRPIMLALVPPDDIHEERDVRLDYFRRKQPVYTHEPWLRPLVQNLSYVLDAGTAREDLELYDGLALAKWLAANGGSAQDYAFIPYSARFYAFYLAVRRTDGRVMDQVVPINSQHSAEPQE